MKIEIAATNNPILHYQVKISEPLPVEPNKGRIDRVTTSPEILTIDAAKRWLLKWLKSDLPY